MPHQQRDLLLSVESVSGSSTLTHLRKTRHDGTGVAQTLLSVPVPRTLRRRVTSAVTWCDLILSVVRETVAT